MEPSQIESDFNEKYPGYWYIRKPLPAWLMNLPPYIKISGNTFRFWRWVKKAINTVIKEILFVGDVDYMCK